MGLQQPRVTVIVPAHDCERYVGEALESVLAQTYELWQLVVADDASRDGTAGVVSAYVERDPRIHLVQLERNVGPALARRAAIEAAPPTPMLALLDADDYWRADYLEQQLGAYEDAVAAGRRPGIMACDADYELPDGTIAGRFSELQGWADPLTYDDMIERSCIFVGAMFTRDAHDKVGGFSGECWGSEDYDLWLRIMEAGYDVVVTKTPLAVYRWHPAGLSRNQLTMADAALAAYGRALRRAKATPAQTRAVRARMRHYRALRARALLLAALTDRRAGTAAKAGVEAALRGAVALLQSPSRWGEWARDALRVVRRGA